MNDVMEFIRGHGVLVVACLAVLEGFFCAVLLRRTERLKGKLRVAAAAAEDAARAAALAAPGGIDPEIVIQLLRSGRPTTLESVYVLMEQQQVADDAARHAQAQIDSSRGSRSKPEQPSLPGGAAADPTTDMTDQERAEMQKRIGRYGG